MIKKAEALISQVGVAMDFLSSNIENLWAEVEKVQDREETILQLSKPRRRKETVARDIHDGPASLWQMLCPGALPAVAGCRPERLSMNWKY